MPYGKDFPDSDAGILFHTRFIANGAAIKALYDEIYGSHSNASESFAQLLTIITKAFIDRPEASLEVRQVRLRTLRLFTRSPEMLVLAPCAAVAALPRRRSRCLGGEDTKARPGGDTAATPTSTLGLRKMLMKAEAAVGSLLFDDHDPNV